MRDIQSILKKIKSNIKLIVSIIVLYTLFNVSISSATKPHNLDIDVELLDGGDGMVTMEWDYTDKKGTEHVIPIQDNALDIHVERNGESYEMLGSWIPDEDLEGKAKKASVVVENGTKIHLGIGDYGRNKYTVSYKVEHLVKSLEDYNMVYNKIIGNSIRNRPKKVKMTIHSSEGSFNLENVRFWGIGFAGEIQLDKSGNIVWESSKALNIWDHGTILIRIDKSFLHSNYEVAGEFESSKTEAILGSLGGRKGQDFIDGRNQEDYEGVGGKTRSSTKKSQEDTMEGLLVYGLGFAFFIICILIKIRYDNYKGKLGKRRIKIKEKDYEGKYYRNLPYDGNPEDIYFLLENMGMENYMGEKFKDYIAYYFLKWIEEGVLVKRHYTSKSILGRDEEKEGFLLVKSPKATSKSERNFFSLLVRAIGTNRMLEENELNRWVEKYKFVFKKFVVGLEENSKEEMRNRDYLIIYDRKTSTTTETVVKLTEKGDELVEKLIGFRNYLLDFSLLNERESINVHIWDKLMMYAALLGVTDEVSIEFGKLYPNYFETSQIDIESIYLSKKYSLGISKAYRKPGSGDSIKSALDILENDIKREGK